MHFSSSIIERGKYPVWIKKASYLDLQVWSYSSSDKQNLEMQVECFFWSLLLKWSNTWESQRLHARSESGWGWRLPSPAPLLQAGHLEQVAQGHVLLGFEYLPGWKLHNLSRKHVPVLGHSHCKIMQKEIDFKNSAPRRDWAGGWWMWWKLHKKFLTFQFVFKSVFKFVPIASSFQRTLLRRV